MGMSLAVTFVMVLATAATWPIQTFREEDHGHQEADARAGGADDGLDEIISVVQVQDGHAQD